MVITWMIKKFDDLSPLQLYKIMQLRNEVFVVEQNCVYQDADNKDISSLHFMGWENEKLLAYTRILPPGLAYPQASIGRVVTLPSARKGGIGRELMIQSIEQVRKLFGEILAHNYTCKNSTCHWVFSRQVKFILKTVLNTSKW